MKKERQELEHKICTTYAFCPWVTSNYIIGLFVYLLCKLNIDLLSPLKNENDITFYSLQNILENKKSDMSASRSIIAYYI